MTITKQQFDNLQVGDVLVNALGEKIEVDTKFNKSVLSITLDEKNTAYIHSLLELQVGGYILIQPIQHNCGFPYGDYSDREVVVRVSDKSIEACDVNVLYGRLITVSKAGFHDHKGSNWQYAVLVSNNVELVNE